MFLLILKLNKTEEIYIFICLIFKRYLIRGFDYIIVNMLEIKQTMV